MELSAVAGTASRYSLVAVRTGRFWGWIVMMKLSALRKND
jgi:hypothetical protein